MKYSGNSKNIQTTSRPGRTLLAVFVSAIGLVFLLSAGCAAQALDRTADTIVITSLNQAESETFEGFDSLKTLDLRSVEADAALVDRLSTALPGCTILWNVPLCNEHYPSEATELTLPTGCTAGDLSMLRFFPALTRVDATQCSVNETFAKAAAAFPGVAFVWNVSLGGVTVQSSDTSLKLTNNYALTPEQLGMFLFGLPALKQIDLNDTGWTAEQIASLQSAYPEKTFLSSVTVFGESFPSSVESLDLSATQDVDINALTELLPSFPALKQVNLLGHAVTFEQMDALRAAFPDIAFSFSFELFGQQVTTDTTLLALNGYPLASPEEVIEQLNYLPKLTEAHFFDCGLTNEQMEQLVAAVPSVKFVWMIQVGAWEMRTDITAFSKGNRKIFPNNMGRFVDEAEANLHNEDIEPLKYCTDLVYLDLGHGNRISDLSVLTGLKNLRVLIVSMNKIEDISPLAELKNLECLEIYQNPITDISPVASLPKLRFLNCSATLFTDITPLLGMTNLKMLWFVSVKNVSKEQRAQLVEALPDCSICFKASSSGEGGWTGNDLYIEYQTAFGLPYNQ
ncbi:MAG: leucine-rich repeat domain-containing protein [Eubacteriales bacterium]|nr:leucine-rich repeat domain-containing protein [Eubacteriales bacterium]